MREVNRKVSFTEKLYVSDGGKEFQFEGLASEHELNSVEEKLNECLNAANISVFGKDIPVVLLSVKDKTVLKYANKYISITEAEGPDLETGHDYVFYSLGKKYVYEDAEIITNNISIQLTI